MTTHPAQERLPRRMGLLAAACLSLAALLPAASLLTRAEFPRLDVPRGDSGAAVRAAPYPTPPLYFVENDGQADSSVRYYVQGKDTTVFFTQIGLVMDLLAPVQDSVGGARTAWTLALDFVDPSPEATARGVDALPGTISYFKGPREQWLTGLPTFSSIAYRDLWPGIDLRYDGAASALKYSFTVHPGADPGRIQLAYRGADSVALLPKRDMSVSTGVRSFQDAAPYAYQEVNGTRRAVSASYALLGTTASGGAVFGFTVGAYDPSVPLVIDPTVIVYAGFIGGAEADEANGVAVDSSGNAYVVGETRSRQASFPVTVGPSLTDSVGSSYDVFVAKVSPAGALIYAGYIGGTEDDYGNAIAIDSGGNAYVVGHTTSEQADGFPVTTGPDLTYNGSSTDGFVVKVNASGTALTYAGYIGGAGHEDRALGVAMDAAGAAYVVGHTNSDSGSFPAFGGPDPSYGGGATGGDTDGFIAKVLPDGSALAWGGYIGGADGDQATGVAVDGTGHAFVTGNSNSSEATFPVTVGPDLTHNGGADAFVARVAADGGGFLYLGYIGGAGSDSGYGIALNGTGIAYVTGSTSSDESTFPVLVGPDLTYGGDPFGGVGDAFVAKVKADGTDLHYAGYIGGTFFDRGTAIAVDTVGNAFVAGQTASEPGDGFPVSGGPSSVFGGGNEAFVAKVDGAGTAIVWAGYIGGSGQDSANGLGLDGELNIYVVGTTASSEASFPEVAGPDLTYNGGATDAFVVKLAQAGVVPPAPTVTPTATIAAPTPLPTATLAPPTPAPTATLAVPTATPPAAPTSTPTPGAAAVPGISWPLMMIVAGMFFGLLLLLGRRELGK